MYFSLSTWWWRCFSSAGCSGICWFSCTWPLDPKGHAWFSHGKTNHIPWSKSGHVGGIHHFRHSRIAWENMWPNIGSCVPMFIVVIGFVWLPSLQCGNGNFLQTIIDYHKFRLRILPMFPDWDPSTGLLTKIVWGKPCVVDRTKIWKSRLKIRLCRPTAITELGRRTFCYGHPSTYVDSLGKNQTWHWHWEIHFFHDSLHQKRNLWMVDFEVPCAIDYPRVSFLLTFLFPALLDYQWAWNL